MVQIFYRNSVCLFPFLPPVLAVVCFGVVGFSWRPVGGLCVVVPGVGGAEMGGPGVGFNSIQYPLWSHKRNLSWAPRDSVIHTHIFTRF